LKIGVFDSGVGGLTVLKALRENFPEVDLFYIGDTARVPYGNRSPQTVIRYSIECATFLVEKGVDILVVACNTASSYALEALRVKFALPVIGVVEPGVREALKVTKGKVGVIGTLATVRSGTYQRLLRREGVEVFSKACPLFVPLVEEGIFKGNIVKAVAEMYLKDLKKQGIDTLILGCTHYPLLKDVIQEVMGEVNIVDSSLATAHQLEHLIIKEGEGETALYFTDESQNLYKLIKILLGNNLKPVILQEDICHGKS